jgi:hypothetical protein
VQAEARSFFSLYSDGLITGDQIDDFVEAWHNAGDDEKRSLSEYLGMTDDEYAVWVMSHGALPSILAARLGRRPLSDAVAEYLRHLQHSHPDDRHAIHALSHWLQRDGK